MAVHTVPQDVETDDKILGPFNLRQFIYLIIVVALGGVAYLLGRYIVLPLAILPVLPMMFFLILALPLKKDQPMETFLAAKWNFLRTSRKRIWMPGQSETTIFITAPKKIEENRTKGLSRQEVSRRLSFLADIVDTEGYAIKGSNPNLPFNQEVYAEAEAITDMYDSAESAQHIDQSLEDNSYSTRRNAIEQMRVASNSGSNYTSQAPSTVSSAPSASTSEPIMPAPSHMVPDLPSAPDYYDAPQTINDPRNFDDLPYQAEANNMQGDTNSIDSFLGTEASSEPIQGNAPVNSAFAETTPATETTSAAEENPDMLNLANNTDFSVETIAKEANRINEKQKSNEDEVYISLH